LDIGDDPGGKFGVPVFFKTHSLKSLSHLIGLINKMIAPVLAVGICAESERLDNDTGIDDREMTKRLIGRLAPMQNRDARFLGLAHFNAAHIPYRTPKEFVKWKGSMADQYDDSVLNLAQSPFYLVAKNQ
jgi:hypothetical protein